MTNYEDIETPEYWHTVDIPEGLIREIPHSIIGNVARPMIEISSDHMGGSDNDCFICDPDAYADPGYAPNWEEVRNGYTDLRPAHRGTEPTVFGIGPVAHGRAAGLGDTLVSGARPVV